MNALNIKAKRMMLSFGDPALKFIPPQRDLVLVLNCDKFRVTIYGNCLKMGIVPFVLWVGFTLELGTGVSLR